MPLVPTMIQELVHSLPPLGESEVCDLLGRRTYVTYVTLKHIDFINTTAGSGALTVEVKKSYPRCKISVVEKCPYRLLLKR